MPPLQKLPIAAVAAVASAAALRHKLWILPPLKSLHLLQLQHVHLELSFLLCDAPGPRSIRDMIDEQE